MTDAPREFDLVVIGSGPAEIGCVAVRPGPRLARVERGSARGEAVGAQVALLHHRVLSEGASQPALDELGLGLNVHVAEVPGETEFVMKQYGKRPIQFLDELGLHHLLELTP